ncbi:LacI family DNA-binding transcriptional regulator [Asanoa sp. WMMD1127]|uniref:LacI family DNA-binding transcriptional regulator n=1 Tax=Asanoa sp. WMMD1127 TaxID=3016107 RepID=UPI002415D41B|nr:LacI family DNA-binding transcriptional regulator [Asanoa sp. WMMD1127]MDG4825887.1 LacI family DNA-binding transcriptional regulator [Asanoa sp. WMMD1127]
MDTPIPDSAPTRPLAMSDVAARAGVSHQTVSRVINRHPHVAVATRARVLAAIEELGYRPNGAARALATGETRTIGLATANISQYGPAQTMVGLEHAARAAGYSLTVQVLDDTTARTMTAAIDRLATQSLAAIIALSTYDETVRAVRQAQSAVPLIAVQAREAGHGPAVWVDQTAGAALATRHLLDLGHRTVHHVTGPAGSIEATARRRSWRAELEAAGAPVPSVLRGDWWPASGHAAGRELVARRRGGESVTAVFVANDQMAFGLLNAFYEAGLRVPEDVSVVGFDNVPEAPYSIPPLTTVRQDFAELGRRGVQLVLELLRGEQARPRPVAPQLLVRATTAPPARGPGRGEG